MTPALPAMGSTMTAADVAGVMEEDDLLQLVGQGEIFLGQALGESIFPDVEGVGQVIHPPKQ